jgi:thiamine-phosphate pyrophosphorylase
VPSLSEWRLYVIVDAAAALERDLASIAAAAIRGGADAIQLRNKRAGARLFLDQARSVLALTAPAGIPLLINDRPDVAVACGASGVHLGQDDLPLAEARKLMGPGALIGQSTHSLAQALQAQETGADYIGIGPIFATPTKPDFGSVGLGLVSQARQHIRIPFVCIGGIDSGNIDAVIASGARAVAVVRAVCSAEDPESAARDLKNRFAKFCSATASL